MSDWKFTVVTLSGLPGSGTTTAARLVTEVTGLRHVNTGAIFREMARERGMTLNDFGKLANQNPAIDRELDARQIEICKEGNILLEGRLAGYMLKHANIDCLAVWLHAPIDERVRRVSGRDQLSFAEARRLSVEREEDERKRFVEFYGFDLAQTTVYDLVLDSSTMRPDAICEAILTAMRPS
jgi:cytidylate kinase